MEVKPLRTLILLLTTLFLLTVPAAVHAQFIYTTNSGKITITGYTGPGGVVTIPSTINGLEVTSIGQSAFQSYTSLANIIIPNSVTSIGFMAFIRCTSLTNATIPSSVTIIDAQAFLGCSSLMAATIPTNLIVIGQGAFQGCTSLTNVMIPASVTSIGGKAFDFCLSLTAITVSESNAAYSSLDGVLFNKSQTTLIQCPGAKIGSYTIPGSVTNIGTYAFDYCTGLSNITISASAASIESFAFRSCTSLTNVIIPASVTSIGDSVFSQCSSLNSIVVDMLNPNYASAAGALFNKSLTTLVQYPAGILGNYTVPSSVTKIGNYAFDYCTNLSGITIPDTVTSIGTNAFGSCMSLTSVTIPNSVTNIGTFAFYYCINLRNVLLPDHLTVLRSWGFASCSSLTSITIPNTVTNIEAFAFNSCTGLVEVYFAGSAPVATLAFSGANNATVYYLPGTTGWGVTFGGRPTALWNPQVQTLAANFGVQPSGFGLPITGTTNIPIVLEAAIAPTAAEWAPLHFCSITNGSVYFTDLDWTNHPARYYRIRSP